MAIKHNATFATCRPHKFYGFGQIRYSVYDAEFGEFPFPVGFFSGAEEEQCDSRLQVCQLMR